MKSKFALYLSLLHQSYNITFPFAQQTTLHSSPSLDQMKSLREDLSKVQKELQSCQNNMNTLNKKLTYDM